MELNLKVFSPDNTIGFPRADMNIWITQNDKDKLYDGITETNEPQFVKVECKDILCKFTMYAKLAIINSRVELGDNHIWIPKDLIHKSWLIGKSTKVEVSLIKNLGELRFAESIIIDLNPQLVENWSEDEANNAKNYFVTQNRVSFDSQMVFIKPGTKKVTIGEIDAIYPKSDNRFELYRLDSNTKVIFNGLAAEQQKVIDFSQIGGLSNVINRLREIIQIPINHPEYLEKFGVKPPKGMLMYGPPGNGKTMVARAVAHSMGSAFITIEGPELMSKYVGVGEQRLREKFEEAETKGNCVIFIDEIDSIASKRSDSSAEFQVSIVATLLNLMDGMKSTNKIFVIGATNRLNAIDPALRRPGRFDLEFEVPLPNLSARQDILSKYIKLEKEDLLDKSVNENTLYMLSELTNGFSGADISLLYREAVMHRIRNNIEFSSQTGKINILRQVDDIKLLDDDFYTAMRSIVPTSLRGTDIRKNDVDWAQLIALDEQKKELEEINTKLNIVLTDSSLKQRPSFSNILLKGKKGSGKHTFIHAFAQKFGYEILEIDLISLSSFSMSEAYQRIDETMTKSKQTAPSVLVLSNLEKVEKKNLFAYKILNEINKLNKHLKIISFLTCEDITEVPDSLLQYKGYEKQLDFDTSIDIVRNSLKNDYNQELLNFEKYKNMPIGQIISIYKENELIGKYNK